MSKIISQKDIIKELSNLDLTKYPYLRAKLLIEQLYIPYIKIILYKGDTILRGRLNLNNERFNSKSDLSYKPKHLNKSFQRASSPNMTMFYGTFNPEGLPELDRMIGVMESLPWLRDKESCGVQKITFGKWNVINDINLLAIVQHEEFHNKNQFAKSLNEEFLNFIKNSKEVEEDMIFVSDFFAKQFAKTNIDADFEYILSAIFTEKAISMGMDGVLYPCTRTEGTGFNVAITPEAVDRCLDLVVVGECQIYKYYEHSILDNGDIVELVPNQLNFELHESKYQYGEQNCLKQLGLLSIYELKK